MVKKIVNEMGRQSDFGLNLTVHHYKYLILIVNLKKKVKKAEHHLNNSLYILFII
jgi:hypothetical protein